jgi:16S rRNA (cytosine1402-N4)-methyltransferase
MMLAHAQHALTQPNVFLIHASYAELEPVLDGLGIAAVDRVLIDLGLSSDQLADASRGFSFDADGPLDMRFDTSHGQTAADLINRRPEAELARILYEYGEERHSRRIARRIVAQRPIRTAAALAEIIRRARCLRSGAGSGFTRPHGPFKRCGSPSTTNSARCGHFCTTHSRECCEPGVAPS